MRECWTGDLPGNDWSYLLTDCSIRPSHPIMMRHRVDIEEKHEIHGAMMQDEGRLVGIDLTKGGGTAAIWASVSQGCSAATWQVSSDRPRGMVISPPLPFASVLERSIRAGRAERSCRGCGRGLCAFRKSSGVWYQAGGVQRLLENGISSA